VELISKLNNSVKLNQIWINKKSGNEYIILGKGHDRTNIREGTKIIIYKKVNDDELHVREFEEFFDKFELKK